MRTQVICDIKISIILNLPYFLGRLLSSIQYKYCHLPIIIMLFWYCEYLQYKIMPFNKILII